MMSGGAGIRGWSANINAGVRAWAANADRGDLKVFHIHCGAVHPFSTLQLIITVGCIKIRAGKGGRGPLCRPFDVAGDPVLVHCTGEW